MDHKKSRALEFELKVLLNRASRENASNTPDFILAQYLMGCLEAFEVAVQQRDTWYGRDARPKAPFLKEGGGATPVLE